MKFSENDFCYTILEKWMIVEMRLPMAAVIGCIQGLSITILKEHTLVGLEEKRYHLPVRQFGRSGLCRWWGNDGRGLTPSDV
jgi:hypothetical protein